jgi:D-alanyl-D-alanine carboxypeptidase (penicillin-binding protein 5/6)
MRCMTRSRLQVAIAALCAFVTVLSGSASHARAQTIAPVLSAPEAIAIDGWTGNVLYEKNANVQRYPASTVKIMTALIVLERHIPMTRVVTVSQEAATIGGTSAGLYIGERMSVRNLLYGMLLPSGNDAAIALSQAIAGTTDRFAAVMNAEARRLKLWHTHYRTPNGFDVWGQVTTARDLANLTRAAMQWGAFAWIVRQRNWSGRSADGTTVHPWSNRNELLWRSSAVDGVKTGTTPGAGACLVSSARRGGKWVIEVNMGSTVGGRFTDGMALLNYGFLADASVPATH